MKILVDTTIKTLNPNTQEELGNPVVDTLDVEFEVHPSLVWHDADDTSIMPGTHYYDGTTFREIPTYVPPTPTWEDNQREAIRKLAKDNVRNYQSLLDADESSLLNKAAIVAYYNQLVDVKNNPVDGDIEWLAWEEPNWAE